VSFFNIYALTDAAPATQLRGALGEPIRALATGRLFALAGAVDEPPALTPDSLRAHEAAVRRLADACAALLPVRFGAAVEKVDLESREAELLEALNLVRGREQMTLRVYGEAKEPQRSSGTAYLESLRRTRAVPEIDLLRSALAHLVRAERTEVHGGSLVASVYHLVDRGRAPEYLRIVAGIRLAVRVAPSGPWPAWSFAPEAVR
jgi:hypothetical protein